MGWQFSLDGVELNEDDLTAGQLERLYVDVNARLRHEESAIGQAPFGHCPVCRVAVGTLALEACGVPADIARATIRETSSVELAQAFVSHLLPAGE